MRETRIIMGMPVMIEIAGSESVDLLAQAFGYLVEVDQRFSNYKSDSEITAINQGQLNVANCSLEMKEVLALAETTRWETRGYFDIRKPDGRLDPSGIVKGWAIRNAAWILAKAGATDFFVDAGGDIQSYGRNAHGGEWTAGIRDPFHTPRIVKTVYPRGRGIATSGSYIRGHHIYDPHLPSQPIEDIVSLTVVGPDVLEADRFATAAFAMGLDGIGFIESQPGLEGYLIDPAGIATMTSGFEALTQP